MRRSGIRRKSTTMEWVAHEAGRLARWLVIMATGRVYLEGFVDGLHGTRWRGWWRQATTSAAGASCYEAGYAAGERCDRERELPPERLN